MIFFDVLDYEDRESVLDDSGCCDGCYVWGLVEGPVHEFMKNSVIRSPFHRNHVRES